LYRLWDITPPPRNDAAGKAASPAKPRGKSEITARG
jgi:hypothetical protein